MANPYESRAGVPIAVVTITLSIATTAVALRTYARAVMIRQFGADDWAAVVAVILALGSGIMVASSLLLLTLLPYSCPTDPHSRYTLWSRPASGSGGQNSPLEILPSKWDVPLQLMCRR